VSKFTPGPWEAAHAGQGSFGGKFLITEHFVRRPGDDVAIAADVIDPESGAPSEANARLIAAAPALLEALQAVIASRDNNVYQRESFETSEHGSYWAPSASMVDSEAIAKARAAIASATGEKP
jgi:hypothetical protein